MALNNFKQEIWSAILLVGLRKALVYGALGVVNKDYQGEIQRIGNTVKINAIGDPTISDYDQTTAMSDPETLTDAGTMLTIEKAKSFNFRVDDVDAVQANLNVMPEAMSRAAYKLKDQSDQYLAGKMVAAAGTVLYNDTTPYTPTVTAGTGFNDAYDKIVDMGVALDETNTPEQGRWCIVPPFMEGLLRKDNRFVGYGTPDNKETLTDGFIGKVNGMMVMKSNNVPNVSKTKYKVLAGHSSAVAFAEQINQIEAFRSQRFFADQVRGLYLFGAQVTRPECLVLMSTNRPS